VVEAVKLHDVVRANGEGHSWNQVCALQASRMCAVPMAVCNSNKIVGTCRVHSMANSSAACFECSTLRKPLQYKAAHIYPHITHLLRCIQTTHIMPHSSTSSHTVR
jgi:hypothetical protein